MPCLSFKVIFLGAGLFLEFVLSQPKTSQASREILIAYTKIIALPNHYCLLGGYRAYTGEGMQ